MDAFSMFEDVYPSADSAVSGIITLLAAAEALGKVKDTMDPVNDKPIMFTFLNGVSIFVEFTMIFFALKSFIK